MQGRVVTCATCGRPIVPDDKIQLSPIQRRILNAVDKRGEVSTQDLRDIVWADDPNGGPDNPDTLYVHVFSLNQKLAMHGIEVRAGKGAGAVYRIQKRA